MFRLRSIISIGTEEKSFTIWSRLNSGCLSYCICKVSEHSFPERVGDHRLTHYILELENVWVTVVIHWLYDITVLCILRISLYHCHLGPQPLPWPITPLPPAWSHHLASISYLHLGNAGWFALASALQPADQPLAWCFSRLQWIRMEHHRAWDRASS